MAFEMELPHELSELVEGDQIEIKVCIMLLWVERPTCLDDHGHGGLLNNGAYPGKGGEAAVVPAAVLLLGVSKVKVSIQSHRNPLVLLDMLQVWIQTEVNVPSEPFSTPMLGACLTKPQQGSKRTLGCVHTGFCGRLRLDKCECSICTPVCTKEVCRDPFKTGVSEHFQVNSGTIKVWISSGP